VVYKHPRPGRIQGSVELHSCVQKAVWMKPGIPQLLLLTFLGAAVTSLQAGDLRITLPKQSRLTPVQALNRDGVKEVKRGRVDKAKQLFVRAYLLDPDDPFTLNNLGYISELEGDADHALKYYELAAHTGTEAVIDEASKPGLKGQSVNEAFPASEASAFKSNKANVQAIVLLEKGRIFEAESLLKTEVQADPNNPFLLDTLGYAMESEGDLESALRYYSAAASLHSDERVLLTPRKRWRGRPVSELAAQNAKAVSETMAKGEDTNARIARLNLRGVSALNHNDALSAEKFFAEAYTLDPDNAFTLNNIAYVAERNGDRETAEMYYEAASVAEEAGARVTYATRPDAEGRKVGALAGHNQDDVESALKAIREVRRRARRPIELKRRDETRMPENTSGQQPPLGVKPPPLPPLRLPDRTEAPKSVQPSPPSGPPSPQPDGPPQ
jgi:Flp pilus assembly protein TadD